VKQVRSIRAESFVMISATYLSKGLLPQKQGLCSSRLTRHGNFGGGNVFFEPGGRCQRHLPRGLCAPECNALLPQPARHRILQRDFAAGQYVSRSGFARRAGRFEVDLTSSRNKLQPAAGHRQHGGPPISTSLSCLPRAISTKLSGNCIAQAPLAGNNVPSIVKFGGMSPLPRGRPVNLYEP